MGENEEEILESQAVELIDHHLERARAEIGKEKISEARASLAKVESLLDEKREPAYRIQWLLESGRLDILEKEPSQARGRFVEAWTLSINSGEDSLASEVAMLMAEVEPQKRQQEWISRGIRLAEDSSQADSKRWLGRLYASLGWKLFGLRQFDAALAAFQSSLSRLQLCGTPREVFVARWSVGKLLRSVGRLQEALEVQNALLTELSNASARDGRVFQELAECLHALKRVTEAQVFFELAYEELSADGWMVDNQPDVLKRLRELAKKSK